ncbi:class II aldolase/adducin family protein [Jiangella rhizosphaerae]|uniref:Class II aldolase/adducin family protein n=1 Tax=Jiangella rhizosphaerae TaxID=2293569 RepID=A0A418KMP6_9ACTN|nr:class II aldolase/adducin family protein [Jiangella rhizosphaerae]RIQ20193.1 class II aldolase/adducin family protein [Jiangella rhizosphaerae]
MTTLDTFDLQAARESVLAYCLESVALGLNFNTQGNISIRIPGTETFLITPTDLEYDKMTPADLVVVDEDANVVDGRLQPSSEVTVHLAVYAARPDVQAIVHTEPTFANVFGVLGEPIRGALVNMVIYTKGDVPVMPFALSNSTEFGVQMASYLEDRNAVVWANHGLLTVGPNLRDAFKTTVAVESAAKVLTHARAITSDPIVLDYASLGITHAL